MPRLLDVAFDVEERQRAGDLRIAAGTGRLRVLGPDRDGLEDGDDADQPDGDADQDFNQRQTVRRTSLRWPEGAGAHLVLS